MPLSLDDEVFVEKCFQRSLLVRSTIRLSNLRLTRPFRNLINSYRFLALPQWFGDELVKSAW